MTVEGPTWDPTPEMRALASPIRRYASDLIEVLDRHRGNIAPAYGEVMPILHRFLSDPTLQDLGVRREGNHTPGSQWLYHDYELEVDLSTFKPDVAVPVHNHGTWEFIAPHRGTFSYTSFVRVDDRSTDGLARLEAVEERTLQPGDAAVCGPPPDDIHTFTAHGDDVLLLGMNHGPLASRRTYYDVAAGTFEVRDSKAWRLGRE